MVRKRPFRIRAGVKGLLIPGPLASPLTLPYRLLGFGDVSAFLRAGPWSQYQSVFLLLVCFWFDSVAPHPVLRRVSIRTLGELLLYGVRCRLGSSRETRCCHLSDGFRKPKRARSIGTRGRRNRSSYVSLGSFCVEGRVGLLRRPLITGRANHFRIARDPPRTPKSNIPPAVFGECIGDLALIQTAATSREHRFVRQAGYASKSIVFPPKVVDVKLLHYPLWGNPHLYCIQLNWTQSNKQFASF
jgi:hypothetical protein